MVEFNHFTAGDNIEQVANKASKKGLHDPLSNLHQHTFTSRVVWQFVAHKLPTAESK